MKQEQLGPLKVAVLVSVNHLPTGLWDGPKCLSGRTSCGCFLRGWDGGRSATRMEDRGYFPESELLCNA